MLKNIQRVPCWQGLAAGFSLQLCLARWLCDEATTSLVVYEPQVRALHVNQTVQDWLWNFLLPRRDKTRLLDAARDVADATRLEKQSLLAWINVAGNVAAQFQPVPPSWSASPEHLPKWSKFKELMLGFYKKGFNNGLPFDSEGNPAVDGVSYKQFVDEFKQLHGEQSCVICGGPLGRAPHVDHWVNEASFPVLSIAPDNLLPMCQDCNEAPAKGQKPTFALGVNAFAAWFHPYHRAANGRFELQYDVHQLTVRPHPLDPTESTRVNNLDQLFQLTSTWTRTFKAKYLNCSKSLRQHIDNGDLAADVVSVAEKLAGWHSDLVPDEPHYLVHGALLRCAQEQDRLAILVDELQR
jgi:hypothetical protein